MNRCSLLLFIFALMFLLPMGCEDDDEKGITFKGISATDENGVSLSAADPNDWRTDVDWSAKEAALFADIQGQLCPNLNGVEVRPAFPNPCQNTFIFSIVPEKDVKLILRLVDKNFEVKRQANLEVAANQVQYVSFNVSDISKGIYRLYYKIQESSCEYRGYGDVKVD